MAREWSLQETKALVEEHIALKQEAKLEARTASEHWNKVAMRLRERGYTRSHKSCNKRWYRLEQYEVQIFSFNMEEGKERNYWDLTRGERLERREKWPQLPSGDGIDKQIFDSLKSFSQTNQFENRDASESTTDSSASGIVKEAICPVPKMELDRTPPISAPFSHPMVASAEFNREELSIDSHKQSQGAWPAPSDHQQPLSSQDALDGFKLQARELRRRRAIELRRKNRTVPYNTTQTTFMKTNSPLPQLNTQNGQISESKNTFGLVTKTIPGESPTLTATETEIPPRPPPIQFKRVKSFFSSYKSPNQTSPRNNRGGDSPQQQPSHHFNFQSSNPKTSHQEEHASQEGNLPLLHSVNSHLPLLQPTDNHLSQQHKNGTTSDSHHPGGDNLSPALLQLGSLEDQLQVILGVYHGPLQTTTQHSFEPQLHKKQTMDGRQGHQFRRNVHERANYHENGFQGSATESLMGAAIGGLGVQLGAIVKLLQAKHSAEQQFREKLLMFVECVVVSLNSLAQASLRTSG